MNNQWKPTKLDLFGIECLRHATTHELTAWGELGCLYESGPNQLAAIQYKANGDEEMVKGIEPSDIQVWMRRLRIPARASKQLPLSR